MYRGNVLFFTAIAAVIAICGSGRSLENSRPVVYDGNVSETKIVDELYTNLASGSIFAIGGYLVRMA